MILLGEYAVLEGAPALVCAVDRYAEALVAENNRNEFSVAAPSLDIEEQPFIIISGGKLRFDPNMDHITFKRLHIFKTIFESTWQFIDRKKAELPPLNITLNTDAFYSEELKSKFGFGSSAAITAALIRALFEAAGIPASNAEQKADVFRLALTAHHKAQGNIGSGIDIASSVYGGALIYEMTLDKMIEQKIPEQVEVWQDLFIIPIWSGRSASTRKMVSGVDQLKNSQPSVYNDLMEMLKELSRSGCAAYKNRDSKTFFADVKAFNQTMAQLGEKSNMPIISPAHQKLASIVESQGAVYKPSGAGGGDIGIAFTESADKIEVIAKEVETGGFKALDIKPAPTGVCLK